MTTQWTNSTASITTRTRMMVQDIGRPFVNQLPVDGVSTIYDLAVESVSATNPLLVILGGVSLSDQATPPYTVDYKYGTIQFSTAPGPAGTLLQVSGWTYDFFDDDEVLQAVTDAFNLHVQDQSPLPVQDPGLGQIGIDSNEQYLVSILAAIELLWFRATDAAQQINIETPEGVHIPVGQRYQQIVSQIQALQEEYKTMAGALGVGLWRIQVLWQRRVSYTTNRLVPIYEEQEYNAPYTGFNPTSGVPGTSVTIMGMYFTGATQVTFGGIPSTDFAVISDTQIVAVVPVGGVTGQIGITTPGGVVLSTAQFVVGQPPPFVLSGPEMVPLPIPPGT